jgi:hypothetical protein
MRFMVTAAVAAMAVLTTTTAVRAIDKELAAYDAAALQVCERHAGMTPEMQAKYDVLVASLDQAQVGYGRSASPSNFWAPASPQQLVERCVESPGDGAAAD